MRATSGVSAPEDLVVCMVIWYQSMAVIPVNVSNEDGNNDKNGIYNYQS